MSVPLAQLSCQQCQRRKTKCSKSIPCSACTKAGIECTAVQRHRLPRGRSGNKRTGISTLRDRVGNLESIIARLQNDKQASASGTNGSSNDDVNVEPPAMESFVAPNFWSELSSAVAGLKEVLESPDSAVFMDDSNSSPSDKQPSLPEHESSSDPHGYPVLFPSLAVEAQNVDREMQPFLMETYKQRVDTIFKVLHWPTASKLLQSSSMDQCGISPGARALQNAVFFTATCSLFDHEIANRQDLLDNYRRATEAALTAADLLTTSSLETLQAFVIYLAGLRACRANATQWTLTATAIRIAHSQKIPEKLHDDYKYDLDTEMRRRLWSCIGVLDLQSAFDRGTEPIITSDELQSAPMNVDDDFWASHADFSIDAAENRFTEMSFARLNHQGGICQRKLNEIGSSTVLTLSGWQKQVAVLADFENHVQRLEAACTTLSAIQKFAIAVGKQSLVAMRLLLYRPLHKRGNGYRPAIDSMDVLTIATETLERSQMKRGRVEFMQWSWFAWVKWYALAVVLAELCSAQGPQADHAFDVAQRSYNDYARIVADTKTGLLWKPISKLMQKVTATREHRRLVQAIPPPDVSVALMQLDEMSWAEWDILTEDIMNTDYDNMLPHPDFPLDAILEI